MLTGNNLEAPNVDHAISDDGSRIFWSTEESGQVYVRIDGEETEKIEDPGTFLTASADGSKVLLDDGCLYDLAAEECEDLTLDEGEVHQGGFLGILGASEDLSRLYFVDEAALAAGAEPGICKSSSSQQGREEEAEGIVPAGRGCSLYAWEAGSTTFLGVLLSADNAFGGPRYGAWKASRPDRTAQVSPDGERLAFMTRARLKPGYDNTLSGGGDCGATLGSGCFEVYEYAAESETLTCASCNPAGQRPLGGSNLMLLRPGVENGTFPPFPQPSNLTPDGSGRLFFESQDSLVSQDINGSTQDVYQWEPNGVGGCKEANGCVNLISSGHDPNSSLFLDASANGNDVFFITRERLLPRDKDSQLDLYDARVGGGFEESTTAPCSGEACKGPISPPPPQPSASSSEFAGPGNEASKPKNKKKHHKKKKHHHHKKNNRGGSK
jgi:hypothetical protein